MKMKLDASFTGILITRRMRINLLFNISTRKILSCCRKSLLKEKEAAKLINDKLKRNFRRRESNLYRKSFEFRRSISGNKLCITSGLEDKFGR